MIEATYRILLQADSTYAVEVIAGGGVPGSIRRGAFGFASEAEAEAWIAEDKRRIAPVPGSSHRESD